MTDQWRIEKEFLIRAQGEAQTNPKAVVKLIQDFPFQRDETWILEPDNENVDPEISKLTREFQVSLGEVLLKLILLIEKSQTKSGLIIRVNVAKKWPHAEALFANLEYLSRLKPTS